MATEERPVRARRLDDDLWVLDTQHQGEPGVIAAYLLTGPAGLALVDTGPGATVRQVVDGITSAGYQLHDLRHIALTHVHLDHAGAAGALAQAAPAARVYVHPLGAPHLVDPSRLVASAQRIYGEQMQSLWGAMEPIPAERIQVPRDGEWIAVGSRTLQALYTPGHAVHHIAYYDGASATLFAGDVAGVALEGIGYVRPPTPPPDLNLEDWSASLRRLRELSLQRLLLPHFGPVTRVAAHLQELEERLYQWGEIVLAGMRAGKDTAALVADIQAASEPEIRRLLGDQPEPEAREMLRRYELATNYQMTVQGYERYYRKQHAERL
jgi:glyoxylase-like metal-dependent hydrolase (beta-lactamase superfamily II)